MSAPRRHPVPRRPPARHARARPRAPSGPSCGRCARRSGRCSPPSSRWPASARSSPRSRCRAGRTAAAGPARFDSDRRRRRRLPPRPARHRRARRAGHHRRVRHRHDPLEPHGGAAPAAGPVGQARGLRGGDLRARCSRRSLVSFFAVQAIVTPASRSRSRSAPRTRCARSSAPRCSSPSWACSPWASAALVRNTAGGIASFVGAALRAAGHRRAAPGVDRRRGQPLPAAQRGFAVATSTFENSHHLAPWTGFAVFAGYAALAVAAAAVGLLRRDA